MTTPAQPAHTRIPPIADQERAALIRTESPAFGDIAASLAAKAGTFPGDAASMVRDAEIAIAAVSGKCREAIREGARVAPDKQVPADGRRQRIREIGDDLTEYAADRLDHADALLKIAEATLTTQAMPKVTKGTEHLARADARMLLDGVPAAELPDRMRKLAARNDDIGSLAASSWGADYLASRGQDTELHSLARQEALRAAQDSGDQDRAAAAEALGRLRHMSGAVLAARRQAHHASATDLQALMRKMTS